MSNKLKDVFGLFFENRESESTKPFVQIRYVMATAIGLVLILSFTTDFNIHFIWLLLGIGSIIDAIESYCNKEKKKQVFMAIGFAFLFFIIFLT
ncbi:hypothetical protein [Bacillus sp. mrc49]|uniref:hypothetical protein n=1 Tax=Bacillus sp. mrc49 TaxID=2054913 RepID=UPI000C27BD20|nr:hypothetical protein [Bacillus sp. mrc49]PJN89545.1 hypothetical protein CVN76_14815 [Bacillus sp. mrc49]